MPTTTKKRQPVKITFAKKRPERDLLWSVYSHVLNNWAVGNSDIIEGTKLDKTEVNRLTRKLASVGLLAGEHVNSERSITWQTFFDVENDRNAKRNGRRAFDKVYPKGEEVKVAAAPVNAGHRGNTGPRYTPEQIAAAVAARADGKNWKEVAVIAGVKSPFHFSKVVRSQHPDA
jgi:predicted transcriptional regulator